MSINSIDLTGNLTRDLEARQFGERWLVRMGLAVNERARDRDTGEWSDYANFVDVEAWASDKQWRYWEHAMGKGSKVSVHGALHQDRWTDRHTGDNRSRLVVKARDVEPMQGQRQGQGQGQSAPGVPYSAPAKQQADPYDPEIPF